MMREYQVRICERLGVKFPGAYSAKPVLTPLKWDVCFTPRADIGQATLPIAMSSSATVANCWAPRAMAVAEDAFSKRTDELID
jgi:hypothetical protein